MKKTAFVTYAFKPELTLDDAVVLRHLPEGVVEAVPWDAAGVDWAKFDAVVLRSCWDYHLRIDEFRGWLARLEADGARLYNDFSTVRRNTDKFYLRDLTAAGIRTIPTVWIEQNAACSLAETLRARGWRKAVVKPAVSATAFETRLADIETARALQPAVDAMLRRAGVLVQPFVEEIVAHGEFSFVFFDKKYSHAVLKRAKSGDFRVQSDFGGVVERVEPPAAFVEQAREVLDFVPEDLLYARVDGVEIGGKFFLMELELIEPQLFLSLSENAARRFAAAILDKIDLLQQKIND
ncbi:MAG: hypothetical protein JSS81_24255 [Acidobacteria bacterium]|nr:hypothetical protein [Acidobacteriota bacterium]